jgi:hypothetical protein
MVHSFSRAFVVGGAKAVSQISDPNYLHDLPPMPSRFIPAILSCPPVAPVAQLAHWHNCRLRVVAAGIYYFYIRGVPDAE